MKILFTGASSFTGMWFVQELAQAGHEVTATFLRSRYDGVRKERVEKTLEWCTPIFDCPFGSERFIELAAGQWDLFCHHAADVRNYKSPDFDVIAALENNTKNLKNVLTTLQEGGCGKIILTGSVFEQNEGRGSEPLRAFSPYGLSKGLTWETFNYYTTVLGMTLKKFVIPNPFGPYEEPRFTHYLVNSWFEGKTPVVGCPDYVRDNIHVSLLSQAYTQFAESPGEKINPSGYRESQGAFTKRFAAEMEKRLEIPCPYELGTQTEFPEPKERVNTDDVIPSAWDEQKAWDDLANYYQVKGSFR